MLLLLQLLACSASAGTSWRHLNPSRPIPRTLSDAIALHAHGRREVHKAMLRAGHAPSRYSHVLGPLLMSPQESGLQAPLDTGDRVFGTFEACIYAGQGIVCIALKVFVVGDAHAMTVAMSPLQIAHMIIGI